jgi:hypothetical protein
MERAWPFEGVDEKENFRHPRNFLEARGEGVEAVIIRIGLHDAQLVLVDAEGAWQRWVYHSVEDAKSDADELGIPIHLGEYPEELRVRLNKHVKSQKEFDRAAYPEQGAVGPVIPYPENRPRRLDVLRKEVAEEETPEG